MPSQAQIETKLESQTTVEELSWDSETDPRNPRNWSSSRKWILTILVSTFAFCTMMTSTLVAPAVPNISKDLHIQNSVVAQLVITSYVFSYAFGPFIWAPLSEQFGRLPILQAASTWFFIFNLICGFAQNEAMMIAGRVLSGIGAAAALAIGPGVLSDCWAASQRGRSLAILSVIPLLAPAIGPIIGGQVAQYSTWRWAFWSTSAFNALIQFIGLLCLKETHAPTILRRIHKQEIKARSYDNERRRTSSSTSTSTPPADQIQLPPRLQSVHTIILKALYRPIRMLITQPSIQIPAIYAGINFGALFTIISSYSTIMSQTYDQTSAQSSLHYLSIGIGFTLGAQLTGFFSDKIYMHFTNTTTTASTTSPTTTTTASIPPCPAKSPQTTRPELRILPLLPATLLTTIGLLIYAWTTRPDIHWVVPDLGIVLFALGTQSATQATNAYVIDCWSARGWSASAMAGIWALKSLCGFGFPLFEPAMVADLALGSSGTYTVWAGIQFASGALCLGVVWVWGERLRAWGERWIGDMK